MNMRCGFQVDIDNGYPYHYLRDLTRKLKKFQNESDRLVLENKLKEKIKRFPKLATAITADAVMLRYQINKALNTEIYPKESTDIHKKI